MSRLYLAVVLFIVPATLRAQDAFTPLDIGLDRRRDDPRSRRRTMCNQSVSWRSW